MRDSRLRFRRLLEDRCLLLPLGLLWLFLRLALIARLLLDLVLSRLLLTSFPDPNLSTFVLLPRCDEALDGLDLCDIL